MLLLFFVFFDIVEASASVVVFSGFILEEEVSYSHVLVNGEEFVDHVSEESGNIPADPVVVDTLNVTPVDDDDDAFDDDAFFNNGDEFDFDFEVAQLEKDNNPAEPVVVVNKLKRKAVSPVLNEESSFPFKKRKCIREEEPVAKEESLPAASVIIKQSTPEITPPVSEAQECSYNPVVSRVPNCEQTVKIVTALNELKAKGDTEYSDFCRSTKYTGVVKSSELLLGRVSREVREYKAALKRMKLSSYAKFCQ